MKRIYKEGLNGVVEKINNERITLLWTYQNNSKIEVKLCHNQMLEYLGITKKCKTPLNKKRKNYLHFETREEKILELLQQNLDELLKNELNHEEPP